MQPFETAKDVEGIPLMGNGQTRRNNEIQSVSNGLFFVALALGLGVSLVRFNSNSSLATFLYTIGWFSSLCAILGFSLSGFESMKSLIERLAAMARVGMIISFILFGLTVALEPDIFY